MSSLSKWDRASIVIAAIATGATILCYPKLPDPMPVHFDIHGNVDGYMPRWIGASMMVFVGGAMFALLRFGDRFLPAKWGARMGSPVMRASATLLLALLAAVQGIILYAGVASPPNVARVTAFALSAFCLGFGLVMPKLRRNAFAGIRTPWTMRSDEVWARTHRLGGHLMVLASLVGFFGALIGSLALAIVALLVAALVATVYSFLVARDLKV